MNLRNLSKYPSVVAEIKATSRKVVMSELEIFPSYAIRAFVVGPTLCGQFADKLYDVGRGYDMSMLYSNPTEWVRMQASLHGMNMFKGKHVGGLNLANVTPHKRPPQVVMEFCGLKTTKQLNKLAKEGKKSLGHRVEYMVVCGDTEDGDGTSQADAESDVKAKIRKMKKAGDLRTLHILSIGMGSRSFSVSEIEVVILGFDRGSENATEQKALRVLTEGRLWNGEIKKQGVVVLIGMDYNRDGESMSKLHRLVLSDSLVSKGEDKTTNLRDGLVDTLNAWDVQLMDTEERDGKFKSVNPNEILTQDNVRRLYQDVANGCFDSSVIFDGDDEIISEIAKGHKAGKNTKESKRQLPKNKKNNEDEKYNEEEILEGDKNFDEDKVRKSNYLIAYESIIGTVGNVFYSLLGIVNDEAKIPKTYLECIDQFPIKDPEILEILGTSPWNVKKLITSGSMGLREDYLNEIYLTHFTK